MGEQTGELARPRKRSRYPQPGSMASAWWEFWHEGRYHFVNMDVVVVATSAHRHTITETEALALLREAHGPSTTIGRRGTWHSVTQRDIWCGDVGDSEPGDWNEGGTGTRWVDVIYPDEATVLEHIGGSGQ